MSQKNAPIAPHPLIARMLRAAGDGGDVVELRGYPGHSAPDTLTLFLDLSLSRYLEIPQDAILASADPEGDANGPTKVYVRASSQVVAARRVTAAEAVRAASRPSGPLARQKWHLECDQDEGGRYCWPEPGEE
ncbi:hypothetical protein [Kitasatospora camelliae]|uniref:Uncharacterized protein n=1 Tax=Kitasatospora camelliae TaxID=3156397 RepID=A0AAU8JQW2_9ACTN